MATKKRKKKKSILKSRFYQIYFALTALALIGIAIGTVVLTNNLRDYESAQPVYVAERVAELFETSDYERIYTLDTSAQAAGGDRELYIESLRALSNGRRIEWTETFSDSENARNYSVTLDGDRFATFTLVPNGLQTKGGNRLWGLRSITTNVTFEEPEEPEPYVPPVAVACRITAPTGYTVTVNGVALNPDNAQTALKPIFQDGFLPANAVAPTLTEYSYTADTEEPEVTVTAPTGQDMPVTRGEGCTWSCALLEDEALKARYSETALKLGRSIARYTSQDGGRGGILRICINNSPAQKVFNNLSNTFATPHFTVDFRNEVVSDFYRISDTCFTCHVAFDFVLNTKNGEMPYPTAYTFCVVSDNGGGLYNLLMY